MGKRVVLGGRSQALLAQSVLPPASTKGEEVQAVSCLPPRRLQRDRLAYRWVIRKGSYIAHQYRLGLRLTFYSQHYCDSRSILLATQKV